MSYFQDMIEGNHCFGCGPLNENGLSIKSRWKNETESVCIFSPLPHHCAAPTKFLNGGIIATIIDCHCICTAIVYAYKKNDREIGTGEKIWYATSGLNIDYKRPVSITEQAILRARLLSETDRKLEIECILESGDKECVKAIVIASIVPPAWML